MKILINKAHPQIRITAPEIEEITTLGYTNYEIAREGMFPLLFNPKEWTLVEEEPVDLEKLALEKYPVEMVFRDPFDERNCDDGEEDINEDRRDAYLQGLKVGYNLGNRGKI